jgi:hypothetical protein
MNQFTAERYEQELSIRYVSASATKPSSLSITSANPATIRICVPQRSTFSEGSTFAGGQRALTLPLQT